MQIGTVLQDMPKNAIWQDITNRSVLMDITKMASRNSIFDKYISQVPKIEGSSVIYRIPQPNPYASLYPKHGYTYDQIRYLQGGPIKEEAFKFKHYFFPIVFGQELGREAFGSEGYSKVVLTQVASLAVQYAKLRDRRLIKQLTKFDANSWFDPANHAQYATLTSHVPNAFRASQVIDLYDEDLADQADFGTKMSLFLNVCHRGYLDSSENDNEDNEDGGIIKNPSSVLATNPITSDETGESHWENFAISSLQDSGNSTMPGVTSCNISDLVVPCDWRVEPKVSMYLKNKLIGLGSEFATNSVLGIESEDLGAGTIGSGQITQDKVVAVAISRHGICANFSINELVAEPKKFDTLKIHAGLHINGQADISRYHPLGALVYRGKKPIIT